MNSVLHNFLHKSALKNWALTIPLDTLWTRFKNLIWKSFIIRPLKMVLRLSIVCSCFYRLLKPYHMMKGRKWREIPEKKKKHFTYSMLLSCFSWNIERCVLDMIFSVFVDSSMPKACLAYQTTKILGQTWLIFLRLISLISFNFYACLYKNASARQNMQHGLVAVMHHVGVFVGLVCINHIILYSIY